MLSVQRSHRWMERSGSRGNCCWNLSVCQGPWQWLQRRWGGRLERWDLSSSCGCGGTSWWEWPLSSSGAVQSHPASHFWSGLCLNKDKRFDGVSGNLQKSSHNVTSQTIEEWYHVVAWEKTLISIFRLKVQQYIPNIAVNQGTTICVPHI